MPQREDVAIVIGDDVDPTTRRIGSYFGYWSEVEIKRSIDTYSSVTFRAPFQPERPEFRETFRPFSFKRLELLVNLETLFTGFLVPVDPDVDPMGRTLTIGAYAKPAVFHDCNPPPAGLPHEYKGLLLRALLEKLATPFGIGIDFRGEPGTPIDKVKIDVDKKIQEFLAEIVKQKNRVLTDTRAGDLLCWQSVDPGNPVAHFVEGVGPLGKVTPAFSPQEYFSEITGFGKRKRRVGGATRWTEQNPWLTTPLRPHTFKLDDTERADVPEATRAKLGRMFANMASYTIPDLPGWRDPHGNLWEPNTTITLQAPSAMIYRKTELLIRDVTLQQNPNKESATLEVVLPGAFSGKIPDALPWDEADT